MSYIPIEIPLASRVSHTADGRHGFVVGRVQGAGWNRALVPVAVEGSTRNEYWPITRVAMRPQQDQLQGLGGNFIAPKGFPLCVS